MPYYPPAAAVIYYGEEDPGAAGAGAIWLKPSEGQDDPQNLYVRNEADTGWIAPSFVRVGDGDNEYALLLDSTKAVVRALDSEGAIKGEVNVSVGQVSLSTRAAGAIQVRGLVEVGTESLTLETRDSEGVTLAIVQLADQLYLDVPTANPNIAGAVWSDSGTLKVSAG